VVAFTGQEIGIDRE